MMNLLKRYRNIVLVLFLFAFFIDPSISWGFPEMSRHGYGSCVACHFSPSGGGILNDYGRTLSNELLSSYILDEKDETDLKIGDLNDQEKENLRFYLGADVRSVGTFVETKLYKESRYILMQMDLEGRVQYREKFGMSIRPGLLEKSTTSSGENEFFLRTYSFDYTPIESISLRLGRFRPSFGLGVANHTLYVRQDLEFGLRSESHALEFSWLSDSLSIILTPFAEQPDRNQSLRERGATLSLSYFFLDHFKVGLSLFRGQSDTQIRTIAGPNWVLGITDKIFFMSEIDWQSIDSEMKQGYAMYHRFNYEWVQGVHTYIPYQLSFLDLGLPTSKKESLGVGAQFFPIKYFELNFEWLKERTSANDSQPYDVALLLFHLYY